MKRHSEKRRQFRVFLIKPDYRDKNKCLSWDKIEQEAPIRTQSGLAGTLYVKKRKLAEPEWASFFHPYLPPTLNLAITSISGLYLLTVDKEMFAVTFGFGRSMLEPGAVDETFGLRFCLNTVDPESVRAIDKTTIETVPFHSRDQSTKRLPLTEFGVDYEKDILKAITGRSLDEKYGASITGTDSASVTLATALEKLPKTLRTMKQIADKGEYKKKFPGLGNIAQVTVPALVDKLNNELELAFNDDKNESVWVAAPEIVDWSGDCVFKLFREDSEDEFQDISRDDVLLKLTKRDGHRDFIRTPQLKRNKLFLIDKASGELKVTWRLFDCVYAEIEKTGHTYILSNGAWYCLNAGFVAEIDRFIKRVPMFSGSLPTWGADAKGKFVSEGVYNKKVASSRKSEMLCLDAKNIIYGGGRSSIEACDLLDKHGRIYHVKRYSGSSVLSHLFQQGLNSAELLLKDEAFVRKVKTLIGIKADWIKCKPNGRINPAKHEVVFAIATRYSEKFKLPFFSRLALKNAVERLTLYGIKASIAKIDMDKLAKVA